MRSSAPGKPRRTDRRNALRWSLSSPSIHLPQRANDSEPSPGPHSPSSPSLPPPGSYRPISLIPIRTLKPSPPHHPARPAQLPLPPARLQLLQSQHPKPSRNRPLLQPRLTAVNPRPPRSSRSAPISSRAQPFPPGQHAWKHSAAQRPPRRTSPLFLPALPLPQASPRSALPRR